MPPTPHHLHTHSLHPSNAIPRPSSSTPQLTFTWANTTTSRSRTHLPRSHHITSHRPCTAPHCTALHCNPMLTLRILQKRSPTEGRYVWGPGKLWMPGTVRDLVTLVDETEMRLEMSGTRRLEVRPRLVMRGTVS
ncbi:hypothetical protein KC19_1G201100 [Ceratodon purpureus]|uniref:Uncharacterized protein n=1 Tax=Ceratodon purpureus TaxID=3225 RepID=A0A8T0J798_CERPU|nr:hypothetical protein KC19_1G201100 [Ceratodon purpureus]